MKTFRVFTKSEKAAVVFVKAQSCDIRNNAKTLSFFSDKGEEIAFFNLSELVGYLDEDYLTAPKE
jgi:hypothetical protein